MKKQVKTSRLLFIFGTLLFLVGCSDLEEIDQRAYVLGIGLDKSDAKGF